MSRRFRGFNLAAGLAVAVAATLAGALPAAADPSATPKLADIVGVGSDTSQDVLTALANGYNSAYPSRTSKLASFDATPRGTMITPATGCSSIARPDGSGAGIAALRADTTGCIDFARSSRANSATEDDLVFIPFAKDALSYAYASPTTNAVKNLTKAELASIYTCSKTRWNSVRSGAANTPIRPHLPQTGSGSRATFLTDIGLTESDISAAKTKSGCNLVDTDQENDPAVVKGNADRIYPFAQSAFTVGGGTSKLGIALSSSQSGGYKLVRNIFNVVKEDSANPNKVPTKFTAIFGSSGYICSTAGQNIVKAQGFFPVTAPFTCGVPVADVA